MSGAESELIQFITVVVSTAAVYCVGYSAGKSRGFVEAVKMAVFDGNAKVVVEKTDTTGAEADAANAVLEFTSLGVRLAARERGAAPAAGTARACAGREVPA